MPVSATLTVAGPVGSAAASSSADSSSAGASCSVSSLLSSSPESSPQAASATASPITARTASSLIRMGSPSSASSEHYGREAPMVWSGDLDDRLDLDRDVEGQLGHADGGTGMAAGVVEDLHQEVGAAVGDGGHVVEPGGAVDHNQQLHDPADPVERTELGPHGREQGQAAEACRLGAGGRAQPPAQLSQPHPPAPVPG